MADSPGTTTPLRRSRRGIQAQRQQITACTEVEFLDIWIDQALDGTQLSDLTELDDDV